MSHLKAAHGWGGDGGVGGKTACVPKFFHTYPNMMKLGTVVSYPKKIQKDMHDVTHPLG